MITLIVFFTSSFLEEADLLLLAIHSFEEDAAVAACPLLGMKLCFGKMKALLLLIGEIARTQAKNLASGEGIVNEFLTAEYW